MNTHNKLKYFICHSFSDQAWQSPDLSRATFEHVDLSGCRDNQHLNEMSILQILDSTAWKDIGKRFYGLGHYRRWLDIEKIEKLEDSRAYVHFEKQPMPLDQIWEVYHSKRYFDIFFQQLLTLDPALHTEVRGWMASREAQERFCARNLFILPKRQFELWRKFMKLMTKAAMQAKAEMKSDPIWQDRYQKRQPGFMLERMTAFWLAEKSGLELVDTPMKELSMFSPYQRELRTYVVAVQKDETNLDEWARWHLDTCGFGHIVLYNDGCPPHRFPEDIASRITQMPAAAPGALPTQFMCYQDFLCRYVTKADIALFIDLDEYLNLHGETIEHYTWRNGQALVRAFNWVYYGSKVAGEWPKDSLLKRFRHRAASPNKHVKIMIDLRVARVNPQLQLLFCNPHCLHSIKHKCIVPAVDQLGREFVGPYNEVDFRPSDVPYIAHFYCKTQEEFEKKIKRGRCDAMPDSDKQYWKQEEHMWEEFEKCDRNEVFDDEFSTRL